MKYGVNLFIWTASFGRDQFPILRQIKEHGFDVAELVHFGWVDFPAADTRRELEANGLEASFCTAFISPAACIATEDPIARGLGVAHLKLAIEKVAETGSKMLAGPFHSPVGHLVGRRRTGDEWKSCVDSLAELGEHAARFGVTLGVEPLNRFESYFLNTAADGARLCEEVGHPNVGILYDTFHANIEETDQASAIRAVAKHLVHVHTCENNRGTPGSGPINWAQVFSTLREVGYDGALVIESFGFAIKEIAAAACIWRDLASSPEAIAWDGIRFLKGQ